MIFRWFFGPWDSKRNTPILLPSYSLHQYHHKKNNNKKIFIWYIPYLAAILIWLQSPGISVAILHSWVYLWRNQGNKRLYLPLSGADPLKTLQYNTDQDTFNRQPVKGCRSCLLAGFSSYFCLLKILFLVTVHCTLLHQISFSQEMLELMEGGHWGKEEWNFRLLNEVLLLTT